LLSLPLIRIYVVFCNITSYYVLLLKTYMHENDFRAGFVALIGQPNAGKSTLMNALLGEKLAITHAKAQTTRHKLYGIFTEKNVQIIYTDTPGMLVPAYPLQEAMVEAIKTARSDADVLLWIVDAQAPVASDFSMDRAPAKPTFLVLNKIDLLTPAQRVKALSYWSHLHPGVEIIPISALKNEQLDGLLKKIVERLPIHPPYYPEDALTDRPERFFVEERIREKILAQYQQEIPYSVEVVVESFKEKEHLLCIHASIHVERQTQKGILIGKQGQALTQLGVDARTSLETFFQKKIFLSLRVKVTPNWRKNRLWLERFGYPATHG
jgi:GTP-binding protein Era